MNTEKKWSYLVSDGCLIAIVRQTQSGPCRFGYCKTADGAVINLRFGKISNNKKWEKEIRKNLGFEIGKLENNDGIYPIYCVG